MTLTTSYGLMKSTRGCEVMYVVLCELALFVATTLDLVFSLLWSRNGLFYFTVDPFAQ